MRGVPAAVAILLIAAVVTGCESKLTDTAHVTLDEHELIVAVADSMDEQARGLSDRPEPSDDEGMLFVWDDSATRAFTISSVDYDVDVIFIGGDKRVNEVITISPDGLERAEGSHPSQYVVEVRGGWADEYGIGPGSEFTVRRKGS